jgi:hypothetical protein
MNSKGEKIMPEKVISIRQPWAWLICAGFKDIENRSWSTKHRGAIFIHAGKKIDKEGLEWVKKNRPDIELPTEFRTGGIVGSAEIVDCVSHHDSPWFFGDFGFVVKNQKPVDFLPLKGQLRIFNFNLTSQYTPPKA